MNQQPTNPREPLRRRVQDWFLAVLAVVTVFVVTHYADIPLNH